jgi:hypothetical protein
MADFNTGIPYVLHNVSCVTGNIYVLFNLVLIIFVKLSNYINF